MERDWPSFFTAKIKEKPGQPAPWPEAAAFYRAALDYAKCHVEIRETDERAITWRDEKGAERELFFKESSVGVTFFHGPILIRPSLPWEERFLVLLHELAHWLGAKEEAEAEAAAFLAAVAAGMPEEAALPYVCGYIREHPGRAKNFLQKNTWRRAGLIAARLKAAFLPWACP